MNPRNHSALAALVVVALFIGSLLILSLDALPEPAATTGFASLPQAPGQPDFDCESGGNCSQQETSDQDQTRSSGGSSSGGGGSGGGGGYIAPSDDQQQDAASQEGEESTDVCQPEINCGRWRECNGGEQQRVCVDYNGCQEDVTETRECPQSIQILLFDDNQTIDLSREAGGFRTTANLSRGQRFEASEDLGEQAMFYLPNRTLRASRESGLEYVILEQPQQSTPASDSLGWWWVALVGLAGLLGLLGALWLHRSGETDLMQQWYEQNKQRSDEDLVDALIGRGWPRTRAQQEIDRLRET